MAILLLMIPCFAFAQTIKRDIKLDFTNTSITKIIESIEKQSGYSFFYNNDINTSQKTSIKMTSSDINQIVGTLLKNTSIDYRIADKRIVLFLKKTADEQKKAYTVTGVINDASGPVIGASIATKSGQGTITSIDGDFRLSNVHIGDVLTISYVGYQTQNIVFNGQAKLNITLNEAATELDQVVVTALGIKRSEKALSYNVQQLSSDDITTVKDPNFMNSLNGKVAGVTINSSASGAGAATRVVMRGVKSITKSNNALYVIDGIPMFNVVNEGGDAGITADQPGSDAVADINPEDIESINSIHIEHIQFFHNRIKCIQILGNLEIAVVSTLKTKESYGSYYSHQNKSYPPIQQFFHISFIKMRRKSNSNLGYSARTLLIFNLISSQRSGEIVVPIT